MRMTVVAGAHRRTRSHGDRGGVIGRRPAGRAAAVWIVAALRVGRGVHEGTSRARQGAVRAQCQACHGESLEGSGPANPLVGPVFTANWDGVSMGDMVDRTRTSMPMSKPGSLSRQQVADVLAFVLSENKFPAGEAELPRQAEILNQIGFLATKPVGKF